MQNPVIVLALDTALGACSAAVLDGARVLAHEHREMPRGHAEALAPMVEDVMRRARLAFSDIERIAVTTGPGTFAGQRVGLAFARALALALKKPAIGVTTLDAMAAEALAKDSSASLAVAAADAKRGELYLGARSREAALLEPVLLPLADAPARLTALCEGRGSHFALAGTAAEMLAPLLTAAGLSPSDSLVRQPDAVYVARLAAIAAPGPPPKPLYLRPPDAKLPAPTLRIASAGDAAALARLHGACFTNAWDESAFASLLSHAGTFALLAGGAGDDRAFILVRVAADESEILTLATRPDVRRLGLARALLEAAKSEARRRGARRMFLEVAADNGAALALYGGAKFAALSRRSAYYVRAAGRTADAVILSAELPIEVGMGRSLD